MRTPARVSVFVCVCTSLVHEIRGSQPNSCCLDRSDSFMCRGGKSSREPPATTTPATPPLMQHPCPHMAQTQQQPPQPGPSQAPTVGPTNTHGTTRPGDSGNQVREPLQRRTRRHGSRSHHRRRRHSRSTSSRSLSRSRSQRYRQTHSTEASQQQPLFPKIPTRISAQHLASIPATSKPIPFPKNSCPTAGAWNSQTQQFQRVALTMHPPRQPKKPGQDTADRKQSDRPFNVFSKQLPPCKTVKPAAEIPPANQRPRMVPYDTQHAEDFMEKLMDLGNTEPFTGTALKLLPDTACFKLCLER